MITIKEEILAPYVLMAGRDHTEVRQPKENETLEQIYKDKSFGACVMYTAELCFWAKYKDATMTIEEFSTAYTEFMDTVLSKMDKIKQAVSKAR